MVYHSVVLMAVVGFFTSLGEPSWVKDYEAARKLGKAASKPLAVVIGHGRAGWDKLSEEGRLDREARSLLAANYVCVYVDTEHIAGQKLADELDIRHDVGLVISDQSGRHQAFRHDGELSKQALAKHLRRYGDPDRVFRYTEGSDEEGYYAEESEREQPAAPPAYFGGGGRSC